MPAILKVRVFRSTDNNNWYHNLIGETFSVIDCTNFFLVVGNDMDKRICLSDIEVI